MFQNGRGPLLLAAAGGHVEVCEILLLQGVDVSAVDDVSTAAVNSVLLNTFANTSEYIEAISFCKSNEILPNFRRLNIPERTAASNIYIKIISREVNRHILLTELIAVFK